MHQQIKGEHDMWVHLNCWIKVGVKKKQIHHPKGKTQPVWNISAISSFQIWVVSAFLNSQTWEKKDGEFQTNKLKLVGVKLGSVFAVYL